MGRTRKACPTTGLVLFPGVLARTFTRLSLDQTISVFTQCFWNSLTETTPWSPVIILDILLTLNPLPPSLTCLNLCIQRRIV